MKAGLLVILVAGASLVIAASTTKAADLVGQSILGPDVQAIEMSDTEMRAAEGKWSWSWSWVRIKINDTEVVNETTSDGTVSDDDTVDGTTYDYTITSSSTSTTSTSSTFISTSSTGSSNVSSFGGSFSFSCGSCS